jgi:hypothetical protein
MSLTETKTIDRIEFVGDYMVLQIREATTIFRDGQEVSKTFHRCSFAPGDSLSSMPENIQAMASVAWTPEVISKYKNYIQSVQTNGSADQGVQP